jgi:hypothetical protein
LIDKIYETAINMVLQEEKYQVQEAEDLCFSIAPKQANSN